MFGLMRPERRSSAGVWSAPQAAMTARDLTRERVPVQRACLDAGGAALLHHDAIGSRADE